MTPGVEQEKGHADGAGDGHDDEDLGPDEELNADQEAHQRPDEDRVPSLPDEELVEAADDQRRHQQGGQHQVGVGEADQHQRGEAVEQPADEGGRRPRHPPPQQQVHGDGGEHRAEGVGHIEGGDGAEDPGHRGEDDAEGQLAGIREQVGAPGMEHGRRVQRVEAMVQRVGRPLEEPGEQRAVPAPAGGDRCRVGRPDVPPDDHRQQEVGGGRQPQRPFATRRRPVPVRARVRVRVRVREVVDRGCRHRHDRPPAASTQPMTAWRDAAVAPAAAGGPVVQASNRLASIGMADADVLEFTDDQTQAEWS